MFSLTKRPLHVLSNKLRRHITRLHQPIEWMKEKWTADFSKPERSCFIIKPEISYNANLEKGALFLGLKKKNCMAWLETENRVYVDQIIEARFHFDNLGGYCAAGIMFRATGQGAASGTYYLALISSKGYFRLDAVNNNIPRPLIGWTETSGLNGNEANLSMIAKGDHLLFFLNGKWFAEVNDASIPGGHLGFALVSYDSDFENIGTRYSCQAWLDFLSVDSRAAAVEAEYQKWSNSEEISAESRFHLAESFAALDCFDAAYNQILKVWKQREELIRSVTATYTEMRTRKELLFAAQMASRLEHYAAAEEYINTCLAMEVSLPKSSLPPKGSEELDIYTEKAKVLSAQNKYGELSVFLPDYIKLAGAGTDQTSLPSLYALLGHSYWNLNDYKAAAAAWDTAFSLDRKNILYAVNAANAFEKTGKNNEALQRCLDGARCALRQKNYTELETLIPKLLALGKNSPEAHELAGKWAAGIGDTKQAKAESALAHNLKRAAPSKEKTIAAKKPAAKTKAKPGATTAKKPATKPKAGVKPAAGKKPAVKTKTATARKPAAKPKAKTSKPKKKTKAS